jgi:hypothetical protein
MRVSENVVECGILRVKFCASAKRLATRITNFTMVFVLHYDTLRRKVSKVSAKSFTNAKKSASTITFCVTPVYERPPRQKVTQLDDKRATKAGQSHENFQPA